MKAWKAELLLLTVTFIWGGTFTFTKIGLEYCSPMLYIMLRFTIAFIISYIFFGKYFHNIDRKTVFQGLTLGVLFGGGFIFQTYGLEYTTVPKSAFITGLSVVLTPFAFYFVTRKQVLFWSKIGVIIAFIGLWIFTKPDFNHIDKGDLLTLISTFFWAFYITYMDIFTKNRTEFRETAQLVMLQFLGAAPVAGISFLMIDIHSFRFVFDWNLVMSIAYNSIIASFLLTFIHTSFQKYTTPVKAALIFSLEPIVASFVAMIFLHEILHSREITGALILMFGVLVSETGKFFQDRFRRIFAK